MKLFIIKSLVEDDGSLDGVGVEIFRSRNAAIAAFIRNLEIWNDEMELDGDDRVDVVAAGETFREHGYVEVIGTSYVLEEYELAD